MKRKTVKVLPVGAEILYAGLPAEIIGHEGKRYLIQTNPPTKTPKLGHIMIKAPVGSRYIEPIPKDSDGNS